MWTYTPQKRQDGSAFALTYRLLLRSCKLMGAFLISPLPPVLSEPLQTAGPLRSTDGGRWGGRCRDRSGRLADLQRATGRLRRGAGAGLARGGGRSASRRRPDWGGGRAQKFPPRRRRPVN